MRTKCFGKQQESHRRLSMAVIENFNANDAKAPALEDTTRGFAPLAPPPIPSQAKRKASLEFDIPRWTVLHSEKIIQPKASR